MSEPKVIVLGRGEWVSGAGIIDGLPSICFGPAPVAKERGTKVTEAVARFATENGALVISFADIAAAVQTLDLINDAIAAKASELFEATP